MINSCFKRNLLDKTLHEKYSILTGTGIQKRYFKIVSDAKRKGIVAILDYLLINTELISNNIELIELIPEETQQSKVKKIKVKETIYRQFKHLSITEAENAKLLENYTQQQIDDVYDRIENYSKNKSYTSLYLTANNWLKKSVTPKTEVKSKLKIISMIDNMEGEYRP